MKVYDYYKEKGKKVNKFRIGIPIAIVIVLFILVYSITLYTEIIQLDEIGNYSSVYIRNIIYKAIFFAISFIAVFAALFISNRFVLKRSAKFHNNTSNPLFKLPYVLIIGIIAFFVAMISKDVFYIKALEFLNSTSFDSTDPIFNKDISYYVFQRPFLMSIYNFISGIAFFVILFTAANYFILIMPIESVVLLKDIRLKPIIRHNLINVAIFFLIKIFSYKFQKEGILYSNAAGVDGASYVDVNIWLKYFNFAPILLLLIVIAALVFLLKGKIKGTLITIAIFPIVWVVVFAIANIFQSFFVDPNDYKYEKTYLKNNMEQTRKAFNIDNINGYTFPKIEPLSKEILKENEDTKKNIRIVDYGATLDSNKQMQSLTPFYNFVDGDIINYNISGDSGESTPVFISAREIDTDRIEDQSYVNKMFRYTHGYGVVINPINSVTKQGQSEFILSGLTGEFKNKDLKVEVPQIYYGELTNNYVVTNKASEGNLTEIDADGTNETNYSGNGGITLGMLERLMFSIKFGDGKLLISSNINSESKLLLNRNIVERAQKVFPFIQVDEDPYILLTKEGRLKWVLDGYTFTEDYPNAEHYNQINYIRNSLKIIIDAYDGKVEYYVIDKNDPIIQTYSKIYPDVFKFEDIPDDIKQHMRYPEKLFKIQTSMLERYHLDPKDESQVRGFHGQQEFWNIATIQNSASKEEEDLEPYYNMIKLPGEFGKNNELILMRPYTPIGDKHNLVSWLAVRNSYEDYGKLILFKFSKNNNVFGPYQVEDKINQIDSISKDMTLWGQSGSTVFKGNLLIIPIKNSLFYVEPIYIKSSSKSIPEIRLIVAGFQSGNDFKYGIGTSLDEAIDKLFDSDNNTKLENKEIADENSNIKNEEAKNEEAKNENTGDPNNLTEIEEIKSRYSEIEKQLQELGKLINGLE